jgi:phage tail sheath protein FI
MTTTYHHGVRVVEVSAGPRAIRTISTSVLGLIATADDADVTVFPANKPVLITDVLGAIAKAGTSGTLAKALTAISNQANPVTVVVRVPTGADDAATTTNVIGQAAADGYTGIQALLAAEAQLGVRPRILGAPGLETQPVVAALAVVAKKLRAMAYTRAIGANVAEVITYRGQFSDREVMLLWPDFLAWNTTSGNTEALYAAAIAMGLRAKIDNEQGWHKSLSNVPVAGVTGISKDVHWDLQNPETDAGLLNEGDITTLVNFNGYRFWGSRTCADDSSFAFETATRTAQILADTIAEGVASYIDKPLYPSIVRDLIESINAKFRELKAGGYILGAEAYYDGTINTSQTLSLGQLRIDYDYTPVPPLEDLQLYQKITTSYFEDFADQINA